MNTTAIRRTCRKCPNHGLEYPPGEPCDSPPLMKTDWCYLAEQPCGNVKVCDMAARKYKCSTKAEVHRTSASKTGTVTMKKSGQARSGRQPLKKPSPDILTAASVVIRLKFPIMTGTKSTESPNISTLTIRDGCATLAIVGRTKAGSNVPSAERFAQSWPIRRAIDALARAISRELLKIREQETMQRTGTTGNGTGRSEAPGKS